MLKYNNKKYKIKKIYTYINEINIHIKFSVWEKRKKENLKKYKNIKKKRYKNGEKFIKNLNL